MLLCSGLNTLILKAFSLTLPDRSRFCRQTADYVTFMLLINTSDSLFSAFSSLLVYHFTRIKGKQIELKSWPLGFSTQKMLHFLTCHHRITKSLNIPGWKWPTRITESNFQPGIGQPQESHHVPESVAQTPLELCFCIVCDFEHFSKTMNHKATDTSGLLLQGQTVDALGDITCLSPTGISGFAPSYRWCPPGTPSALAPPAPIPRYATAHGRSLLALGDQHSKGYTLVSRTHCCLWV